MDSQDSKKLLVRLVWLIFFIFLLNYFAMQFYWYSSVWYLDMPMHFLGGFWIVLVLIWLFKFKEITFHTILKIIIGVLFIGILWEIFEVGVSDSITRNPFNILDTSSDIFFDIAGGLSTLLYFSKRIMAKGENTL